MKTPLTTEKVLDFESIKKDLLIDARAVGIPSGAAKSFTERALSNAENAIKSRKIITENDLKRVILKELKKYHSDFAYVYENRDKII